MSELPTPRVKRQRSSDSSPLLVSQSKKPFKATMTPTPTPEESRHIELRDLMTKSLAQAAAQAQNLVRVSDAVEANKQAILNLDKENKARITENSREIEGLKVTFNQEATKSAARFNSMEKKVDDLSHLMKTSGSTTLDPAMQVEADHEKALLDMIEASKWCVTILGHGEQELTLDNLVSLLLSQGYSLEGKVKNHLIALVKLGAPLAKNQPYKLELDSPTTASSLVDQSRAKSRASNGQGTGLRFVRHFPQQYATAARQFRQLSSMIYESGGLAAIEYEGTTLTLRGKSREPGGEWIIIEGGEFRPLAVGRQFAPAEEGPAMVKARALLGRVLENGRKSSQAKALYLNTDAILGNLQQAKDYLGHLISAGLTQVKQDEKQEGSRYKYTLFYDSRENAIKALEHSKLQDTVTGMDRSTSWLTAVYAVVAL